MKTQIIRVPIDISFHVRNILVPPASLTITIASLRESLVGLGTYSEALLLLLYTNKK
ncbi:hypothetical protein SAMN02745866_00873 [Alteromonadaceae bacterium Bs31]|nr:hypothetical protein SAMN02745866_00873 [Alteromonadaceae bacterium Bs31]